MEFIDLPIEVQTTILQVSGISRVRLINSQLLSATNNQWCKLISKITDRDILNLTHRPYIVFALDRDVGYIGDIVFQARIFYDDYTLDYTAMLFEDPLDVGASGPEGGPRSTIGELLALFRPGIKPKISCDLISMYKIFLSRNCETIISNFAKNLTIDWLNYQRNSVTIDSNYIEILIIYIWMVTNAVILELINNNSFHTFIVDEDEDYELSDAILAEKKRLITEIHSLYQQILTVMINFTE